MNREKIKEEMIDFREFYEERKGCKLEALGTEELRYIFDKEWDLTNDQLDELLDEAEDYGLDPDAIKAADRKFLNEEEAFENAKKQQTVSLICQSARGFEQDCPFTGEKLIVGKLCEVNGRFVEAGQVEIPAKLAQRLEGSLDIFKINDVKVFQQIQKQVKQWY